MRRQKHEHRQPSAFSRTTGRELRIGFLVLDGRQLESTIPPQFGLERQRRHGDLTQRRRVSRFVSRHARRSAEGEKQLNNRFHYIRFGLEDRMSFFSLYPQNSGIGKPMWFTQHKSRPSLVWIRSGGEGTEPSQFRTKPQPI